MNNTPDAAPQGVASESYHESYCLHCEKRGHITDDCWSTNVVNDRSNEIDRLRVLAQTEQASSRMGTAVTDAGSERLQWCNFCGEGATSFCRLKTTQPHRPDCDLGLPFVGAAALAASATPGSGGKSASGADGGGA